MVGDVRLTLTGEIHETSSLVQSEWRQVQAALLPPANQTLQQISIRTTSIEKLSVRRGSVQNRLALSAPPLRSAVKSGLLNWVTVSQIGFFQIVQLLKECSRKSTEWPHSVVTSHGKFPRWIL
jgi:hypothetical protein